MRKRAKDIKREKGGEGRREMGKESFREGGNGERERERE